MKKKSVEELILVLYWLSRPSSGGLLIASNVIIRKIMKILLDEGVEDS